MADPAPVAQTFFHDTATSQHYRYTFMFQLAGTTGAVHCGSGSAVRTHTLYAHSLVFSLFSFFCLLSLFFFLEKRPCPKDALGVLAWLVALRLIPTMVSGRPLTHRPYVRTVRGVTVPFVCVCVCGCCVCVCVCSLDAIITVVDAKQILMRLSEVKPEGVVNEAAEQ